MMADPTAPAPPVIITLMGMMSSTSLSQRARHAGEPSRNPPALAESELSRAMSQGLEWGLLVARWVARHQNGERGCLRARGPSGGFALGRRVL